MALEHGDDFSWAGFCAQLGELEYLFNEANTRIINATSDAEKAAAREELDRLKTDISDLKETVPADFQDLLKIYLGYPPVQNPGSSPLNQNVMGNIEVIAGTEG